jgi:glycosyltransferase involved in cell wall biosynthesis
VSSRPEPGTSAAPDHSGTRKPRVLAVVTFFPWPQNHGDALRRFMFLEALASSSDLTALCIERPETTADDVAELERRLEGARVVVVPPWQRDLRRNSARVARVVRGLATMTPPWIYRQWSPALEGTVAPLPGEQPFDLAVLIGEPAGMYAREVRGAARVIWDKSNVLTASDIDALSTVSSPVGKARALAGLPFSYAFERRVLRQVDEVVVTSEEERQRLHRRFGARPTSTIPSAVNPQPVADGIDVSSRTLLWLSTLSYTPNWDGLLQFLDAADDQLRRGGYTVRVVGADASAKQVDLLRTFPYVDYRGYVEDLADACAGVAAGVVPVWAGAGVKLKTLTLMALGVPLVATPVALEGIPEGAAALVARTPADFAAALESLTPQVLRDAALRARAILQDRFSRTVFSDSVTQLVRTGGD